MAEIIRSHAAYGALLAERDGQFPCDVCGRYRRVTVTVLSPIVKGKRRPRIAINDQAPAISVCWRCLLAPVLRLFVRRRHKPGTKL